MEMRRVLAGELKRMSETPTPILFILFDPDTLRNTRYGDYVRTTRDRFQELVSVTSHLNTVEQAFKGARSELKL